MTSNQYSCARILPNDKITIINAVCSTTKSDIMTPRSQRVDEMIWDEIRSVSATWTIFQGATTMGAEHAWDWSAVFELEDRAVGSHFWHFISILHKKCAVRRPTCYRQFTPPDTTAELLASRRRRAVWTASHCCRVTRLPPTVADSNPPRRNSTVELCRVWRCEFAFIVIV